MAITVYTLNHCDRCVKTHNALDASGIDHEVVNLSQYPERKSEIAHLGYFQAPIVVTDDDHWSGHRPDKIVELKMKALKATAANTSDSVVEAAA